MFLHRSFMKNFTYEMATRIHFGKGEVTNSLESEVLRFGKKILFVYDEIPVKATGLYDEILNVLKKMGAEVTEFCGIEPNPRHTTVNKGVAMCRAALADCIIAAGGGSTIDCAKAVSYAVYHDGDCWDFFEGKAEIKQVLPVIAISTLAATGAEVSFSAVISNLEKKAKVGLRNDLCRPAAAILDPTYTFSVPAYHTACGIVDIMSHTYETYFSHNEACLQDGYSEAIQKTCIHHGRKVMLCPTDYEARAQLMWAAAQSITHITSFGRGALISTVHILDHVLGAYFDIVHGAGIAVLSLAWFRYCLSDKTAARFARWGRNVWDLDDCRDDYTLAVRAIDAFEAFLKEIGLPTRLSELNIPKDKLSEMCHEQYPSLNGSVWFKPVTSEQELLSIFELAY